MTTPKYDWWRNKRINDNIPLPNLENIRPIEEHLQVIPLELDIIKQDLKKKSSKLRKRIKELEEEKIQLGLGIDIQKLEAENIIKGKNKDE